MLVSGFLQTSLAELDAKPTSQCPHHDKRSLLLPTTTSLLLGRPLVEHLQEHKAFFEVIQAWLRLEIILSNCPVQARPPRTSCPGPCPNYSFVFASGTQNTSLAEVSLDLAWESWQQKDVGRVKSLGAHFWFCTHAGFPLPQHCAVASLM